MSLAALAVYGPFLALAIYGSLFLRCEHCRAGLWTVLPGGPGLLPVQVLSNGWLTKAMPEHFFLTVPVIASLAMVAGVARLARRSERWHVASLSVAILICLALAYGVLRLMQM